MRREGEKEGKVQLRVMGEMSMAKWEGAIRCLPKKEGTTFCSDVLSLQTASPAVIETKAMRVTKRVDSSIYLLSYLLISRYQVIESP